MQTPGNDVAIALDGDTLAGHIDLGKQLRDGELTWQLAPLSIYCDRDHRVLRSGNVERVKGIEPSYAAWEAAVLPLNYTRKSQIYIRVCANAGGVSNPAALRLNFRSRAPARNQGRVG